MAVATKPVHFVRLTDSIIIFNICKTIENSIFPGKLSIGTFVKLPLGPVERSGLELNEGLDPL